MLKDLSKPLITHGCLIAKMHAYGFNIDSLEITISDSKSRKKCTYYDIVFSRFYYLEFHKA